MSFLRKYLARRGGKRREEENNNYNSSSASRNNDSNNNSDNNNSSHINRYYDPNFNRAYHSVPQPQPLGCPPPPHPPQGLFGYHPVSYYESYSTPSYTYQCRPMALTSGGCQQPATCGSLDNVAVHWQTNTRTVYYPDSDNDESGSYNNNNNNKKSSKKGSSRKQAARSSMRVARRTGGSDAMQRGRSSSPQGYTY